MDESSQPKPLSALQNSDNFYLYLVDQTNDFEVRTCSFILLLSALQTKYMLIILCISAFILFLLKKGLWKWSTDRSF